MPSVQLNGVDYVLAPAKRGGRLSDTLAERIEPYSPQFSTTGVSALQNLTSPDNRVFPNFLRGYGRDRIAADVADDPAEYQHFWDSRCTTHWGDVRLPLRNTATTELGVGVLKAFAHFNSTLYSLWQTGAVTADVQLSTWDGATTTWGSATNVYAPGSGNAIALDLMVFKDRMIALTAHDNDHIVRHSTDASTWNAPTTTAPDADLLDSNTTLTTVEAYGLLDQIGGEAVAALWDQNNGTVVIFSSTDGDDWSADAEVTIPDTGVYGLAVYSGTDGEDKLYVLTRTALWEVDTAPATWTSQRLHEFPRFSADRHSRRLVTHQGKLWVALDMDDSGPCSVYTLDNGSGVRVWDTNMGLDEGDGVPAEMFGPIRQFWSAGKLLFASQGGDLVSGRNARILVHNGFGWHFVHRNTTESRMIDAIAISAEDDVTNRLHFVRITGSSGSVSCATEFIKSPLVNPRSGATLTYNDVGENGRLDLPLIDGGMPTIPAAWLQVAVDATNLEASNEIIDVTHGLEGAARDTTDLGDITPTAATLTYGSGAGESGVSDALRLKLNHDSGDPTETPVVQSIRMDYDKRPANRNRFVFTIDLDATAEAGGKPGQGPQTVEGVRTALETARDLATLPTLVYGSTGPLYVRVESLRFWEEFRSAARPSVASVADRSKATRFRHGLVEVVCEEKV